PEPRPHRGAARPALHRVPVRPGPRSVGVVSEAEAVAVAPLSPGDGEGWRERESYVRRAPGASFFHLPGWRRVVENTFGHRSRYLAARRGGELVGVLPLFE